MKQQFIAGTADTFRTYISEHNRNLVPSSARITIYKPGSGEIKLVDDAVMAIGADGLLSYELSEADNEATGLNYKASISYDHNSRTNYAVLFYDVVNSKLLKVVTDEDIINELPQLRDNGWKVRGAAEDGSATSIIDSELKRYDDDYFTGGLAYSASKNETREITDFDASTGVVTTEAFSASIAADEKYILTRSYTREVQRAFEKIESKLISLGKRPDLVLDSHDLREVHIYYSVAEVCKGLVADNGSMWWDMWKEYESKGDDAFEGMSFKYDFSEDGNIAAAEEGNKVTAQTRRLGRA